MIDTTDFHRTYQKIDTEVWPATDHVSSSLSLVQPHALFLLRFAQFCTVRISIIHNQSRTKSKHHTLCAIKFCGGKQQQQHNNKRALLPSLNS